MKKPTDDEPVCFWQRRSAKRLSSADSKQCKTNIVGFFGVLGEWAANDNVANATTKGSPQHDTVNTAREEKTDE